MRVTGFDDLKKELERLQRNAKRLSGTHKVPLSKLFPATFMRKHTHFLTIDAFLKAGGFDAKNDKEFDAIPERELDAYVKSKTRFKSWEDMMEAAVDQYVQSQLDL